MALKVRGVGHYKPEDIPTDKPLVILTGTEGDVRKAAAYFGKNVQIISDFEPEG